MKAQIAMFIVSFDKLKIAVSNAPKKLYWLAKEREDIQDLCYELQEKYKSIEKFLTTKGSKHIFIDVHFEGKFEEYKRDYERFVTNAAEPAKLRNQKAIGDVFREVEDIWIKSGKTKEEFYKHLKTITDENKSTEDNFDPFDPLEDDPSSLIEGILGDANLLDLTLSDIDEEWDKRYEKAWGAWRFFKNRIGLNFSDIYKRWRDAPYLFIQPHVA